MSLIPDSYYELLNHAANYTATVKPNTADLLKHLGFQGATIHAQAPIFYVVYYTQEKYLYIDPSAENVFGYDLAYLVEAGPKYYTGLWHQDDFRVYNEKIFPEILSFLKNHSPADYPDFSFSCNYRVQAKSGKYLTLLQRSTFYAATNDGKPLAAVGFIVDISNYKEDTSMIHTIEKIDRNFCTLSTLPLFKSVHFPDKNYGILSKREMDILIGIYEGESSKEIAKNNSVSIHTVNTHRKNILKKTNTTNSWELLRYAKKNGLL